MSGGFFDGRLKLCKATVLFHGDLQFQEQLSYIDKRYDHLRKLTQTLKRKINDLEDIMRQHNDDENMKQIQQLIEDIRREKQMMRDEAHIIRGELSQAIYNADLRSHLLNFVEEFEEVWHDSPKKRLTGQLCRDDEENDQRQSTSQGGDDIYTPSSSDDQEF
ncbi:unnamed protein product [Cylicocyclus nassatus]|uniref:Uncharacterized protein n=1 Tax=Cylicocyclus nassatus TaxID=53992 RepID=A0AA36DJN7_CYLNA|nr:unnamed protein product [Cylicocyclus nassatus]